MPTKIGQNLFRQFFLEPAINQAVPINNVPIV